MSEINLPVTFLPSSRVSRIGMSNTTTAQPTSLVSHRHCSNISS